MNRPLLDTEQLAEILPVTADTLRYWRHIGRGPKISSWAARRSITAKKTSTPG